MRHLGILGACTLCSCQLFSDVDGYTFPPDEQAGGRGGEAGAGGAVGSSGGEGLGGTGGRGGAGGELPTCPLGDGYCDDAWLLVCDGQEYQYVEHCPDTGAECIVDRCERDLVARFRFEEGTGDVATDDSQSALSAQLSGTGWAPGYAGLALDTGADGFADVGDVLHSVTLPVTLSAWVWIDPTATSPTMTVIALDSSDVTGYAGAWMTVNAAGALPTLRAGFGDGNGLGDTSRHAAASTTALPVGSWTHLAAVINGPGAVALYVDATPIGGSLSGSAGTMGFTAAPMLLGQSWWGGFDGHFAGRIDDVRVYDRALTPAEVGAL